MTPKKIPPSALPDLRAALDEADAAIRLLAAQREPIEREARSEPRPS